ncbi:MAG TPA: lysozyme inhibitor LprI family protein [Achromobacter sp.]|uniref:lysozyme inhibitor LprI family protein n=1 Tax=Achromobacter sp. TaxID=134375 RepID=UPI002F93BF0B
MKSAFPAAKWLLLAGLSMASGSALAINCAKAATPAEKLICSDKKSLAADAELNRAYQAILKQAPDGDIRAMLVASQKRWVEARDEALGHLTSDPDALPDDKTAGEIARDLIANRTAQFKERSKGSATPAMIERAVQQQQFLGQFTGGKYAGYWTSCDMLPQDYGHYDCFATRHYQNNDRICSVDEYWASGTVYTKRYVANLVGGKPQVVASCSFNNSDEACASVGDIRARWNPQPAQPTDVYASEPLPKIDGEIDASDDFDWVKACLTEPAYPAAR